MTQVRIRLGAALLFACIIVLSGCAPHARSTLGSQAGPTLEVASTAIASQETPRTAPTSAEGEEGATERKAAWLRSAGLGPHAESLQDWDGIVEQAKREGKVTVYSSSSRLKHAAEGFMAMYPEIQVEALDMGTKDAILALQHEQVTGEHRCDVYFAGNAPLLSQELLANGTAWTFVPSQLNEVLAEEHRSPLVQRLSVDVLIYNTDAYEAPPIDSWWDLTRPEWAGRTFMPDPTYQTDGMHLFLAMVQHPEDMALAYEVEFGAHIRLDEECENAGYQWIKDFLIARPVFVAGGIEVAEAVGTPDQFDPPVGICPYAQYTKAIRHSLYFEPLFDLSPFSSVPVATCLAIADNAPHPNAAKLMIRWLMGDPLQDQMAGFGPWWVLGEYSPRSDIPAPAHARPWPEVASTAWSLDYRFAYQETDRVREFWLAHAP